MIEFVFVGIGYGLLLSVMVGPAFFVLIETSILKGVKAALFLDLGVLLSDIMYVSIAFFFFQEVSDLMESSNRYILKIVGGGCFMAFGLMNLLKKKPIIHNKKLIKPSELPAGTYLMTMLKGFTINAVNPGVLFYWFTLMSLLPSSHPVLGLNRSQALTIYISIILVTFFSVDVLKILGAKKLKEILTPAWMRSINIVLGVVLLCFGALFLAQGIISLATKG